MSVRSVAQDIEPVFFYFLHSPACETLRDAAHALDHRGPTTRRVLEIALDALHLYSREYSLTGEELGKAGHAFALAGKVWARFGQR